jgi:hypothetical protein
VGVKWAGVGVGGGAEVRRPKTEVRSPILILLERRHLAGSCAVTNKSVRSAWLEHRASITTRRQDAGAVRVEQRRALFAPTASCVSALSSFVANSHQTVPAFPPPPALSCLDAHFGDDEHHDVPSATPFPDLKPRRSARVKMRTTGL